VSITDITGSSKIENSIFSALNQLLLLIMID